MPNTPQADKYQQRATNPAASTKDMSDFDTRDGVKGGTDVDANGKRADELTTGEKIKGVINDVVDHITPTDAEHI